MQQMRYGYLDESPSLPDLDLFFIVALLSAEAPVLKSLRRIPKRVRTRILGKKLSQVPELKFYNSPKSVRRRMLEMIAQQPVQLAIYAVDKEGREVDDTPENYGVVVGSAVSVYLKEVHPQLSLTIDKKYTSAGDRELFDQVIEQLAAAYAPEAMLSLEEHAESHRESIVQLADFVVGAAHQKYNREDSTYLEIVNEKVVLDRQVTWTDIKEKAVRYLGTK